MPRQNDLLSPLLILHLVIAVGEIIEWIGFAVACWSLPAAAFAIYTIANLAPRAIKVTSGACACTCLTYMYCL